MWRTGDGVGRVFAVAGSPGVGLGVEAEGGFGNGVARRWRERDAEIVVSAAEAGRFFPVNRINEGAFTRGFVRPEVDQAEKEEIRTPGNRCCVFYCGTIGGESPGRGFTCREGPRSREGLELAAQAWRWKEG